MWPVRPPGVTISYNPSSGTRIRHWSIKKSAFGAANLSGFKTNGADRRAPNRGRGYPNQPRILGNRFIRVSFLNTWPISLVKIPLPAGHGWRA